MAAGFLPMGRLLGGMGGPGFVFVAVPFVVVATGGGGGGGDRMAAATGGGAWGSSLRYAEGAHPCSPESSFLESHQPRGMLICYVVLD